MFTCTSLTPVTGCLANTIEQVRACLDMGENAILSGDILVDASDCDGQGVLDISNYDGLSIIGQGFGFIRSSGQENCSLIYANGVNGFGFTGVSFEETPGPDVPPLDTFPRMIHLINTTNVCMQAVEVAHSWDYAIYLNGGSGFKFLDSVLRDSGALGLYFGNGHTNFQVLRNEFTCNTTNALAVLDANNGTIQNNVFDDNHKLGIFPVAPQFGVGFTGGGQVYLAEGDNLNFSFNTIRNGFCTNCVTAGILNNPVTGLELGLPGQASVTNTLIDSNTIHDNTAFAIHLNSTSTVGNDVVICNTTEFNNGQGIVVPGAIVK